MKAIKLLPVAFGVVLILAFPRASLAGQDDSCRATGQLFGMDLGGHEFLLKSDAGEVSTVHFEDSTTFTQVPASGQASPGSIRLDPVQVNVGDRLCVQSSDDKGPIKKVLVIRRPDIEAQQRNELAAWQARSVFGIITALDPRTRRVTLKLAGAENSSEIAIDVSGPVTYQEFSAGGFTSHPIVGSPLSVGDFIYVRGDKTADASAMTARLIVAGGVRALTGTIESMDILEERIRIRSLLSDTVRTVQVHPGVLHATSPNEPMRQIWLSDLQPGDPVLVLAQAGGDAGNLRVVAVIASFSSFGLGGEKDERLPWVSENGK
jgi:hypothetical protein